MGGSTFKFEGAQELEALLRSLGDSKAVQQAARAALREAAKPIVETAKALAPKDTHKLEQSIKVAAAKRDKGDDGDQVAIVIGIDSSIDPPRYVGRESGRGTYRDPGVAGHSVMQELGTDKMPGRPYMRPAWDGHSGATPDRIGQALGPAIEKVAAKLAKKAGKG